MRRSQKDLAGLHDPALAPLHAALTAETSADELAGEAAALASYRAVSWGRRRSAWRPAVLATKLGVATAAGVIGLSGVATAAYTGSLPDTLQDVAHKAIKAPAAHPPAQAVGPDATGPAAYGLCQAFANDKQANDKQGNDKQANDKQANDKQREDKDAKEPKGPKGPNATETHGPQGHGKGLGKAGAKVAGHEPDKAGAPGPADARGHAKERSVAYRNLVRAAGGEEKVAAYCASVPKPSGEPGSRGKPADKGEQSHPTGKPAAVPPHATGKPGELPAPAQSHPTGSPSPLPTGSPAELPAP